MQAAQTSAQAFRDISMPVRKGQLDAIFDLVVAAVRNGAQDMSLQEIAYMFEMVNGKRIDVGTVSGRVNQLVTAGRLVRQPNTERRCSRSGKVVHPVTVPARQDRFVY